MFDLVLKNGKVVDGTGNPWYLADIGIQGEKITRIGVIPVDKAASVIDAEGLVISPGLSILTAMPTLFCLSKTIWRCWDAFWNRG